MLKAVVSDLSEVDPARRDLYVLSVCAPTAGRWILFVEPFEGFGLGDLKGLEDTAERWKARTTKAMIGDRISAALDAAGVDPAWRDDFAETLLGAVRLREEGDDVSVEIVDENGIQRIGRDGGWLGVDGAVRDLQDRHPRCFVGAPAPTMPGSSSPAPGATFSGKNPFKQETFSLTEQGKLFRENKGLYDRLKAEHDRATSPTGGGNPWRRESFNLTSQMLLVRSDPTRAEVLRAEAEAAA